MLNSKMYRPVNARILWYTIDFNSHLSPQFLRKAGVRDIAGLLVPARKQTGNTTAVVEGKLRVVIMRGQVLLERTATLANNRLRSL